MFPSCHWSWEAEGIGKTGRGGGSLNFRLEEEDEERGWNESERRTKMVNWEMGFVMFKVWVNG